MGDNVAVTIPEEFVGRRDELADLARALGRGRDGRGGLVVVVGEPGIGKTALVEAAIASGDVPALWARARERDGAPALWLWDQVMRAANDRGWTVGASGRSPAAFAGDPSIDRITGTGFDRFRQFDELTRALTELARREPYVVVLDDLQWADAESAAMLEFLAPDLAEVPLVVLATARRGEIAALPKADLVVELGGFGESELRELLSRHVGAGVSDELVSAVRRHTGGSPFFVGEVARLLRASGHVDDPAHWRGVVPEGVRAVLARRTARLPQATHDALGAFAVLGLEADAALLARVLGLDRAALWDRLAPAVRAGLVRDDGDGCFVFAHALVKDAVRSELSSGVLRALHERVASTLEEMGGAASAAAIAAHWRAAGDRTAAARWSLTAAEVAYRAAMYADAAEWFARAVSAASDLDAAVRVRLADALSRSGQVAEANAEYLHAARQARASDDIPTLAAAALGLGTLGGGFEVRLLDADQLALLREALDGLEALDSGDSPTRAVLMARLSVASTLHSSHEQRAALADGAVAMARRLGDDAALAYSLAAWSDAHAGPAELAARAEGASEMLSAARRTGDPELELLARRLLVVAHMERADVTVASRHIRAFAALADSLRQPHFCWYARLAEGMLALLHGDLDEAEALAREAAELGHRARSANAQMLADGALLPVIDRERGGDSFLEQIDKMNRDHPEAARGLDVLPLFGVGYGASEEAVRRALARAGDVAIPVDDSLYLLSLSLRGNGAAFVRDRAEMDTVYREALPFADRFVLDGTAAVCYGPIATVLARIAAARGDVAEAVCWYDRAALILRRSDARLLLRQVETELAALRRPDERQGSVAGTDDADGDARAAFLREGDVWLIRFDGMSAYLRHTKGLGDLAMLLSRPGRELHVLDLVAVAEGRSPTTAKLDSESRAALGGTGDLGPAIDAAARSAYEQRIRDLTEDIEEAEANHDDARAAKLDDERAAILAELAGALGLYGKARPQHSDAERARKAVGIRVREAISRIERELPPLGHHLRHSVRTGRFCAYVPELPVDWHCQP